ncbi:MAG: hypothetical protein P8J32_08300 [bacterium]|nr:hypothetical protein [bacterium]
MFNSFAYNQGQSARRINFNYEIASGSTIKYVLNNNLSSAGRRTRTEISTEGFAFAGSSPNLFLETTTAGTASIILDRNNSVQNIDWIATGNTDTIVGEIDFSTETLLREKFVIAGHNKLTSIVFPSEVNPVSRANSGFTIFQIFNNDLREIDLSPFKNFGVQSSTCFLQIYNNPNLTAVTFPNTSFRMSASMRNTSLTSADFSSMSALTGVSCEKGASLTEVTFPENILSAATGIWNFEQTQLHNIDFSPLGPNFGGTIDLFNHPSMTAVTFPACTNSVNSFFMRACGLEEGTAIDLSPMTGMATSITVRNQAGSPLLFAPSTRSVPFAYFTSLPHVKSIDLSGFDNMNTKLWCHSNIATTAITLGSWSNPFTQFYMMNYASLPELDLTPVTGLGGQVLLDRNTVMTACTLPTTTNTFSEIRFYNNHAFGYFDLKPISGSSSDDIILRFEENNSWDAAIKNHILHDLDNFGWVDGHLSMSGGTAGYDTTSGGYNGFSHYTSLIGKGWTILMTGLTS